MIEDKVDLSTAAYPSQVLPNIHVHALDVHYMCLTFVIGGLGPFK